MRAVLQRVSSASVTINKEETRSTGAGLLILLGIAPDDGPEDIKWLGNKITGMRIFTDSEDKMNLSVKEIEGDLLVISQFTLFASTKKGNRPSFSASAPPVKAIPLYEQFLSEMKKSGLTVKCGEFGAHMDVELCNDGPVTIMIDSRSRE